MLVFNYVWCAGLACLFGLDLVAAVFRFGVVLVGFGVLVVVLWLLC